LDKIVTEITFLKDKEGEDIKVCKENEETGGTMKING
jgi:hypothetical protein